MKIPLKEENNAKGWWEANACIRNTAWEGVQLELGRASYCKHIKNKWGREE